MIFEHSKFLNVAAMALVVGALGGCSDSTDSGTARLTLVLTDAPSGLFESATVRIDAVTLIPADGPQVTLTESAGSFDLLTLQNGVTASIASLEIDPNRYLQLRLVVSAASVTLNDTLQFADGSITKELRIPSGAQSGIKINLDAADGDAGSAGIEISSGETVIVVDFDVAQNFVIQGALGTPAGIQDVLFTPLLRATVRNIAGTISGTVTDNTGAVVVGATVRAELQESGIMEILQTDEATAATGDDGTYTLNFLAPGTYLISVEIEGMSAESQSVQLSESANVTGIDFEVAPSAQ